MVTALLWLLACVICALAAYLAGYRNAKAECRTGEQVASPSPLPRPDTAVPPAPSVQMTPPPAAPRVVARPAFPAPVRERREPLVVRPHPVTLWQDRGWQVHGRSLRGYYRTSRGAFPGRIEDYRGAFPSFYISQVPAGLYNHPHAACSQPQGDGWYYVHFAPRPKDPDSGIRRIEKIMQEILDEEMI
ncbi:MAG: hypothetical protein DRI37_04335 [Chloroflexi bacterium]|nr:MAG: hypothetical protein DRI37_04335 [Chloroflexota bacterium]